MVVILIIFVFFIILWKFITNVSWMFVGDYYPVLELKPCTPALAGSRLYKKENTLIHILAFTLSVGNRIDGLETYQDRRTRQICVSKKSFVTICLSKLRKLCGRLLQRFWSFVACKPKIKRV